MNIKSCRALPSGYKLNRRLDINEGHNLLILSAWSAVLFLAAWIGFASLANRIHPGSFRMGFSLSNSGIVHALAFIGMLAVITAVMLVIHEGLHGLCFWQFTGCVPKFAFKGAYAYAAAPDWFLPKRQYLVTGLAPLVVMTAVFTALIFVLPSGWMPWLVWMLILNTSGCAGDLWMVWALLRSPAEIYAHDLGDVLEIYEKKVENFESYQV